MSWLELVKALVPLGWPIVVVFVALLFKPGILTFLQAILKGKIEVKLPGGIEAKIGGADQQQAAHENPVAEKLNVKPVLDPSPSLAVNLIETRLLGEVKTIDENKREAVLVRALAQSRLVASHEFIYNRIFGSQILALKRLNEVGQATVDATHNFFRPYAEQFPEFYSNYGFDKWLGFLTSTELILQTGDLLQATDFGRDFLVYLTTSRLSENKPW